jgi:uncharacterized lipoprotein YbaY
VYDPTKIHEKGRYAFRARIKADGRLIFTSTGKIPAFGRHPDKPMKIRMSHVSNTKKEECAHHIPMQA